MNLTLYTYWRSSSSYRVRLALAAKNIPHATVTVNLLAGEQGSPEHLTRSPMGYVPCLVVDGRPFVESVAIVELLDELFPEAPLYPREPFARARVRALVELANAGIQPLQNLYVLGRVSSEGPAKVEWARHFNARGLKAYEALMAANEAEETVRARGPFAYGDAFTAADCWLVPQVFSALRYGVDLAAYPRVQRAYQAALATPAVEAAAPENQPDAVPEGG